MFAQGSAWPGWAVREGEQVGANVRGAGSEKPRPVRKSDHIRRLFDTLVNGR